MHLDDYKCEKIIQQRIALDFQANFDNSQENNVDDPPKYQSRNAKQNRHISGNQFNSKPLTNRNNQNLNWFDRQNSQEYLQDSKELDGKSKKSYSFTSPNNSFWNEIIESERNDDGIEPLEFALDLPKTTNYQK